MPVFRFYIGEVSFKGEVLRGEQPAILDRKLFEAIFRSQKRLAIGPDMIGTVPSMPPVPSARPNDKPVFCVCCRPG
jgi:hypothetical protein